MAGKLAEMKEGKTMRMQTKLPIVTVVGAAALLLTVLAVVIAPPSQTAYAQNEPVGDNSTVHRRNHDPGRPTLCENHLQNFQDVTVLTNVHKTFERGQTSPVTIVTIVEVIDLTTFEKRTNHATGLDVYR